MNVRVDVSDGPEELSSNVKRKIHKAAKIKAKKHKADGGKLTAGRMSFFEEQGRSERRPRTSAHGSAICRARARRSPPPPAFPTRDRAQVRRASSRARDAAVPLIRTATGGSCARAVSKI